jgi:uncharacterized protein YqeY
MVTRVAALKLAAFLSKADPRVKPEVLGFSMRNQMLVQAWRIACAASIRYSGRFPEIGRSRQVALPAFFAPHFHERPMLRTELNEALKTAMKARDQRAVSTVRLILAALKDRDIAARTKGVTDGIGEDEIIEMLHKMVRQRRESIELYEKGGRLELAQQEQEEIGVIERYLPKQMNEAEMADAVTAAIGETGASSVKDMGKIMGLLKQRFAGRMDFAKAGQLVKQKLGS